MNHALSTLVEFRKDMSKQTFFSIGRNVISWSRKLLYWGPKFCEKAYKLIKIKLKLSPS